MPGFQFKLHKEGRMSTTIGEIPASKFEVSRRWTPELVQSGGWTPIIDGYLDNYAELGISTGEAMFIIHLIRFKWTEEAPFPSFVQVAKRMGITDTAVRKHARSLEKRGFLIRVRRPGKKTRAFDLSPLFFRLEQCIRQRMQAPPSEQTKRV
jgi:DNA-binding MarR family transcriptional regulator